MFFGPRSKQLFILRKILLDFWVFPIFDITASSGLYLQCISVSVRTSRQEVPHCETVNVDFYRITSTSSKSLQTVEVETSYISVSNWIVFPAHGEWTWEIDSVFFTGGNAVSSISDDPAVLSAFVYAPLTLVDIRRSFSEHNLILPDRRHSFIQKNLERYLIVMRKVRFL
jgi:hypothetical protein